MRNSGQLIFAVVVILIGAVLLADSVLDVDVWTLAWPVGIILLGVFLLLRPKLVSTDTSIGYKLLGDIKRRGDWEVSEEEIWIGVGDVRLDMADADIPLGETCIRVLGFVSDVRLYVPQDVGVSVSSNAFYSEVKGLGKKREVFLSTLHVDSDNYEDAERKIRLETSYFVADIKVRQA